MTLDSSLASDGRHLQLDSAEAHHIDNWQARELTRNDLKDIEDTEKSYASATEARGNPTPAYNCHGMTFGSRRTRIWRPESIVQILKEDHYAQVLDKADILPGDVILYYGPRGDVEHSGLVIAKPTEASFGFPRICSKWGNYREVLHYANICEYSLADIRYYRVKHD